MKSLIHKPGQDIFATINSWPYHLLDGVAASSVRTYALEVHFVVSQLFKGQEVTSYTIITAIDNCRRILTWIETNKSGGVILKDMDKVSEELKKIITSLEKMSIDAVYAEQKSITSHEDNQDEGIDG